MPYVSTSQMQKFAQLAGEGKISWDTFHKWAQETKNITKLPKHKKRKK